MLQPDLRVLLDESAWGADLRVCLQVNTRGQQQANARKPYIHAVHGPVAVGIIASWERSHGLLLASSAVRHFMRMQPVL
jgi:hypothetical protein